MARFLGEYDAPIVFPLLRLDNISHLEPGMKLIYAMMEDGSQILHKTMPDDFDVEEWAEKRKWNFQLLGIKSIRVEEVSE